MPVNISVDGLHSSNKTLSTSELEDYILTKFNASDVDKFPGTEAGLFQCYCNNTDYLYQYLRKTVGAWLYPLSNEVRAMMGHLADYRVYDSNLSRDNLEKAYGHFRRLTLDALKILCDEFDKSLSRQLKKQYAYDYRKVCKDYLEKFAEKYMSAKNEYLNAQCKEKLGSDRGRHNVIELYYVAAKEYIELKQLYLQYRPEIRKVRRKTKIKNGLQIAGIIFGVVVSILSYLIH